MALCERCGSISIVRAQPQPLDKLVRLFTVNRPFLCRRCGWRGRRRWSDDDIRALAGYGAGGAEPDPSLAGLDGAAASRRQRKRNRGRKPTTAANPEVAAPGFDLAELDLSAGAVRFHENDKESLRRAPIGAHRLRRRRRNQSRRRGMFAAIAATALVMFVAVMLGMTGSCSSGTETLGPQLPDVGYVLVSREGSSSRTVMSGSDQSTGVR